MATPAPSDLWVLGCLAVGVPALGWMAFRARSEAGAAPRGAAAPEPYGLAWAGAMVATWFVVTLAGVVALSLAGRIDMTDAASAPLWMTLAVDGVGKGVALAAVFALHAVLARGERGRPARPGGAVLAGLLAGLAFLPVMLGISWAQAAAYEAAGIPMEGQALVMQAVREDAFTLSLVAFFAVVAAPLFEETLFRGFVFGGLRRWAGPWTAALLSAALFAGYHLEVEVLPVTFALGLTAAWLRERTGGLLAPIAMHACYNAVQVAGIVTARGG